MKIVGIIREFDNTGRICIPMEMRKQIWGQNNRQAEIFATEEGILIKPYSQQKTVPVVYAKWTHTGYGGEWECSNCKSQMALSDDIGGHPNYCPECGAKMKGGK